MKTDYSITDYAYDSLIEELDSYHNTPGIEGKKAFQALFRGWEDALRGSTPNKYNLTSLDPGVGKTRALIAFIKSYKASGFKPNTGMIVFLSTLDEVEHIKTACGVGNTECAIVVSDKAHAERSIPYSDANNAPVILTTQQLFHSLNDGRLFADIEKYHYRGKPRCLRVWDEKIDPAIPVTLRVDHIDALKAPLRTAYPAYAEALDDLGARIAGTPEGGVVGIPRGLSLGSGSVTATYRTGPLSVLTDAQKGFADTLSRCARLELMTVNDSWSGLNLAGAYSPLPTDLAPLFILDASGRVRAAYKAWEDMRGTLVRLPPVVNNYARLKVNLWRKGAGASTLEKGQKRAPIVKAVGELIATKPEEPWLILYRKSDTYDLPDEIRTAAPVGADLAFVHWGNHHGTNKFAHIKNVIVVGLFRYSAPTAHALYVAATGDMAPTATDLDAIYQSEVASNLLQGVCRSNVRNSKDGKCGEAEVWIIDKEQMVSSIKTIFPGSSSAVWQPYTGKASKAGARVISEIIKWLAKGVSFVAKNEIATAAGVSKAGLSRVLKEPWVIEQMKIMGVVVAHKTFEFRPPTTS